MIHSSIPTKIQATTRSRVLPESQSTGPPICFTSVQGHFTNVNLLGSHEALEAPISNDGICQKPQTPTCTSAVLLADLQLLFLMPDPSSLKTQRIKEITAFIHSHNLTLNEFLITFYSSQDPTISAQRGRCLVKGDGCRFAPEELIDLWFEHCPSNSHSYLEGVVIKQAGKIIIRETDRACKMDSLSVPTTRIEADDLDEGFLLSKLEGIYRETLPYLWLLLSTVITSWNRSEKQKQEPSACKENRARFVEFLLQFFPTLWLSQLPYGRPVSL